MVRRHSGPPLNMMNINHLRAGATTSRLPKRLLDEFVPTGSIYFSFVFCRIAISPVGNRETAAPISSLEAIEGNTLSLDFDNAIGALGALSWVRPIRVCRWQPRHFLLAPRPQRTRPA
jgi:hypothetical protein